MTYLNIFGAIIIILTYLFVLSLTGNRQIINIFRILVKILIIPLVITIVLFITDIVGSNIKNLVILGIIAGLCILPYIIIEIIQLLYVELKIRKLNDETIYIREIDTKYSVAVISYLFNQKLEKKKDVIATIINLCSKEAISIQCNENTITEIIDLKNTSNLTLDEKYVYNWIVHRNNNKFNFKEWNDTVKREYEKANLSTEKYINLYIIHFSIFVLVFFSALVYGFVLQSKLQDGYLINTNGAYDWLLYAFAIPFLSALIMALDKTIREIFSINKNNFNIYTKNGVLEILRWKKFIKFICDYSLLKEKDIESVVLWEKYLAYSMVLNINRKYLQANTNKLNDFLKFNISEKLDDYIINAIK